MCYYISLSVIIYLIKPNVKIYTNDYKFKNFPTNYMRTGNALTKFRATTFQTVCYQLKQNNNPTAQFESQPYKIEMKII